MPTLHSTLSGADLHEPKGIESASAGTVYVANGSGSGNWLSTYAYGSLSINKNSITKTISLPAALDATLNTDTDYRKIVGTGMWLTGESSNVTLDVTNGEIVITVPGTYQISYCNSHKINTAASRVIAWKCAVNGVLSVNKLVDTSSGSGTVNSVGGSQIKTLVAGDKVSMYAATTVADTLEIGDASLSVVLIKAY